MSREEMLLYKIRQFIQNAPAGHVYVCSYKGRRIEIAVKEFSEGRPDHDPEFVWIDEAATIDEGTVNVIMEGRKK